MSGMAGSVSRPHARTSTSAMTAPVEVSRCQTSSASFQDAVSIEVPSRRRPASPSTSTIRSR